MVITAMSSRKIGAPISQRHKQATEYLEHVHIGIAGPMLVVLVGGWEYVHVIDDD